MQGINVSPCQEKEGCGLFEPVQPYYWLLRL
jgi:hypothetical protein